MGTRTTCAIALAITVLGCDAAPEPASPRAATPATTPVRGAVIGGEKIERAIDWDAFGPADSGAAIALPDDGRARVSIAPAPVLLPVAGHELSGGIITSGATWWAYGASSGGVTLSLQGSAQARRHAGVRGAEARHTVRDVPGWITRNEGIWVLSWIEHGAAFSLEIECADLRMPACRDEHAALEVANGLVFAGGSESSP